MFKENWTCTKKFFSSESNLKFRYKSLIIPSKKYPHIFGRAATFQQSHWRYFLLTSPETYIWKLLKRRLVDEWYDFWTLYIHFSIRTYYYNNSLGNVVLNGWWILIRSLLTLSCTQRKIKKRRQNCQEAYAARHVC